MSPAGLQAALQRGLGRVQFRTREQVRDLFAGLELVGPGVLPVPDRRPDPGTLSARPASPAAPCAGPARRP
jgi:hypothetical protein